MRIRAALALGISVALVAFWLLWLGTTKQVDATESIEIALTARPLLWVDEDRILAGKDNTVYLYDFRDKSQKELYKVPGDGIATEFASSCFMPHEWALFVIAGLRTPPKNAWVVKWTEPEAFSEETIDETAEINPIDCRPQMRKPPPEAVTVEGKEWTRVHPIYRSAQDFYVHPDVADQIALYRSGDELLAAAFKANELKPIQLGGRSHGDQAIASTYARTASAYDRQTDRYLWYIPTNNFDSRHTDWPIRAWWVRRDLSIDSSLELPAGPWVGEYGSSKILSCFSCGCSCYSNFTLYPVKSRLFALVWGRGVLDGQSGIYELIGLSPTSRWQKLVAEDVDGKASATMVFSPSGCRLAYSFGKTVKLLDVCHGDAIGQSRLH